MAATTAAAETLVGHLDAAAYPHLIDLILSASSLQVLLTFRGTSRALKDGVDALIKRNGLCIVVTAGDGDGDSAHMAFHFAGKTYSPDSSRTFLPQLAPLITAVDLDGNALKHDLRDLTTTPLHHLKIFNVHDFEVVEKNHPFQAEICIVSLNAFLDRPKTGGTRILLNRRLVLPDTKKLVVNIVTSGEYREPSLSVDQVVVFEIPPSVEEAVIIFTQAPNPGVKAFRPQSMSRLHPSMALHELIFQHPNLKLKLVDMGYLFTRTKPGQKITDLHHAYMEKSFSRDINQMAEKPDGEGSWPYAHLEMLRLDEYLQRRGGRAWIPDGDGLASHSCR